MYPELVPVGFALFKALRHRQSRNRSLFMRQRFAIFGGIAPMQPAQAHRGNPVAQLHNVHSVLRLNYETLWGWISFASPSVAKLTGSETSNWVSALMTDARWTRSILCPKLGAPNEIELAD